MNSAIYSGTIRHRRYQPARHEFSYRMFMLYLDLAEIDLVFQGSRLFSSNDRAIAEFRRSDHFGDPAIPLDESVRELIEKETGYRPTGPIRLLTHLRYFGYVFNPVSFYYCFDAAGHDLEAIVAEVNNTPWGERHCYVLEARAATNNGRRSGNGMLSFGPEKSMHVSPFMPMDVSYDWCFGTPGDKLNVHMTNLNGDRRIFDATLKLRSRELTPASLRRVLYRFPLMTLKVITAIHWQALRLWIKGCPVHDHPAKKQGESQLLEGSGQ